MATTNPKELMEKFESPDDLFASIQPEDVTLDAYVEALKLDSLDEFKTLMLNYKENNCFASTTRHLSGAMVDYLIDIECFKRKEITQDRSDLEDQDPEENEGEELISVDDLDEKGIEAENVLDDLCDMFKNENGRDPTEDEMKQWISTFQSLTVS